ncbi:hypothetical protein Tco_0954550 [Tanacetum coccineum]|uniref:Uncharacterized protein n=1 Tax=Tanacetum coccineum TaxID=301880 RepID=A0ABQ5E4Q3_9ASTR
MGERLSSEAVLTLKNIICSVARIRSYPGLFIAHQRSRASIACVPTQRKLLYVSNTLLRAWYDKLSAFLIKSGFTKGRGSSTLFTRKKRKQANILLELTMPGCHDTREKYSGSAQFLGHRLFAGHQKAEKSASSTTEAEILRYRMLCSNPLDAISTPRLWICVQQNSDVL